MRSWLSVLLSAALLAVGAASAFAVPSLAGPTGLIMLPTADIAPSSLWQMGVGSRSIRIQQMYQPESTDVSEWTFNALKGVADDAEVFVTYQRVTDGTDTDVWEYGGKYLIGEDLFPRRGFLGGTKVAVGGSLGRWAESVEFTSNAMYLPSDVETRRLYLVATKQLAPTYTGEWSWEAPAGTRIVGTVGLLYLRVDPDLGEAHSLVRPFIGVEVTGRRMLTLLAEYRLKDSSVEDNEEFSVAVRKPFGSSTNLEVGLTNASPIGLGIEEMNLFARITFAFGAEAYQ